MAHFIGNARITFKSENIRVIHWGIDDGITGFCAKIEFCETHIIHLYYDGDDDYSLINDFRETFGYEPLPRNA